MSIKKIVLTGGPCGGKSTGLEWIRKEYEKKGWRVIGVDECATEIINAGITPGHSHTNLDFELPIVQLQKAKEEIFERAARHVPDENVLIIYDRGFLDMKTYCTPGEFEEIARMVGMNETEMLQQYDGIFHLESTAKGAEEYYTFANNKARYQSIEEARKADDAILEVWKEHPYVRIIDNSTSFEEKMERLILEIDRLLEEEGVPHCLLHYVLDLSVLPQLEKRTRTLETRIMETRLYDKEGRIRTIIQSKAQGQMPDFFLKYRMKNQPDGRDILHRISKNEYVDLLLESDPAFSPLLQKSWRFVLNGHTCTLHTRPNENQADLEVAVERGKEESFVLPEFLEAYVCRSETKQPTETTK